MPKLSRRELGRLAAALAVAPGVRTSAQQAPAPPTYTGPLTGIDSGLDDRQFDPVAFAHDLYATAPRRLRFQARTLAVAEAWQSALRAKLIELVGGFPATRAPLRPTVLETRSYAGYRREKVVFDSRPGVSVLAYVLMPVRVAAPSPSVICLTGMAAASTTSSGSTSRGMIGRTRAGTPMISPFRSRRPAWPPWRSS